MQTFNGLAFLGAAIAAISVYTIGSFGREGLTPMKLTLAGAAIAAMFSSFTQGLLVVNEAALEQVLFWLAGSVQGRKLETLQNVLPYIGLGWLGAILIAGKMNILSMGEDVAKGLGLNTGLLKLMIGAIVILLAGGSVAVAGPIGFVGIVVPHVTRSMIGIDHRWVIPLSGVLGRYLITCCRYCRSIYLNAIRGTCWSDDGHYRNSILYFYCKKGVQWTMSNYKSFRVFNERMSFLIDRKAGLIVTILLLAALCRFCYKYRDWRNEN